MKPAAFPILRLVATDLVRKSLLLALTIAACVGPPTTSTAAPRVIPRAYLGMPRNADGNMPALLSKTGAFEDTRNLIAARGLIPYDLVVAFWSDGAAKQRFVAIPEGRVIFSPTGAWQFPKGTVFVKTFELPIEAAAPNVKRRLETRLLVVDDHGGVYGVDYKWRADRSDADLLTGSLAEDVTINAGGGAAHRQAWYYPSRQDCLTCHNDKAGGVLGVAARQMNHDFSYPSGVTENELRVWNRLGLFGPGLKDADLVASPRLAAANDITRSLEDRARSYLDANCSHCHRPGGTVANFDARYDTPLDRQEIIDGPVLIDEGIDRPRIIAPRDIWRSVAFMRVNTVGDIRMPPLARQTIDQQGVNLLQQWILSMPGRAVLDPPAISPPGGTFDKSVEISLSEREPGAKIRYTLDGTVPGASDPLYDRPISVAGPTVLRARAFKEGFTRSITAQQVFIVGK